LGGVVASELPSAERVASAFARALLAGEVDVAAAHFAGEGRLLTADGTEVCAHTPIAQVLAQLTVSDTQLEITLGRTVQVGEAALCTQYWRLSSEAPDVGPFERTFTATLVLGREPERWAILIAAPWGPGKVSGKPTAYLSSALPS
jgi:ketosteroid isomerase-like protein